LVGKYHRLSVFVNDLAWQVQPLSRRTESRVYWLSS
jgi:hypothetical protein